MKTLKIYVDTSIFIAEFDKNSPQHKILTDFLKEIEKAENIELCYSKWALSEMNNKLTKQKIEELKIIKYIKDLLDVNKLRSFRLKPIDVRPNNSYDFNDFFRDIAKDLVKYKNRKGPSLGDIIHIRIMRNNRINTILTFDSDFENIRGFTSLNLGKIEKELSKKDDKNEESIKEKGEF